MVDGIRLATSILSASIFLTYPVINQCYLVMALHCRIRPFGVDRWVGKYQYHVRSIGTVGKMSLECVELNPGKAYTDPTDRKSY